MSKTYRAIAEREEGWWVVTVPDLDIVTQAKRVDQIERMARDLIAAWLEFDYDDVAVEVDVHLPDAWRDEIDRARQLRDEAQDKTDEAARMWARAAADLYAGGLPYRDVGAVLGVSFQRAKQLVDEAHHGGNDLPKAG